MESLYRKYRPQTFDTMVGQKHIVSTLENALNEGRTAHAYLFSGPRGTGKTTTARLLAKALLCEGGPTAHPDGTCEQCEAIAAGTHPDVYELDAASRTGVDNVREEIINRVAFAPSQGRSKVYIIDEVHMLTTAAFNALLKTLEEPPGHVVFVLCTTDPQKVPETILSRCQRLEFHRITLQDIEERLTYVCEAEGFSYDREAIALVAKHARGGLRDALSMLEQLSVFGDRAVRLEDAQAVLGEVSEDALAGLVKQVAARDVAACFTQVADLADRGTDIAQFVRDLTRYVRNVYVVSVAGPQALEDPSLGERLEAVAKELGGSDRIAGMLDLLGRLESELRTSLDQRLSLEVTLTRMARPKANLTLESLSARVDDLERELAQLRANGVPVSAAEKPSSMGAPSVAATHPLPTARPMPQASAAIPRAAAPNAPAPQPTAPVAPAPVAMPQTSMDPGEAQRLWGRTVDGVARANPSVGALLRNADGVLSDDGTLTVINRGAAFAAQMLMRPASLDVLTRAASDVYGCPVRVTIAGAGGAPAPGRAAAPAPSAAAPKPAMAPARSATVPAPHPAANPAPAPRPAASGAPLSQGAPAPSRAPMPSQPAQTAPAQPGAQPVRAAVPNAAAIAAAAAAAAAARDEGRPVPASAAQVGTARPAVPLPGAASPAEAPSGAPAYEFVPDDVYDTYAPYSEEEVPEPSPQGAAVAALSGASKQPVPAPAEPAGGALPWEAPKPAAPAVQAPVAPAASASANDEAPQMPAFSAPDDPAAIELAQMLSTAFGGYVKVSRDS